MTVDWVLKNFCLVVLFFSSRSNHRAREAYWVFNADVLCERMLDIVPGGCGEWDRRSVSAAIKHRRCTCPVECELGKGKNKPNTTYPNSKEEEKPSSYRVGLLAQANFSAPTFEPAHEARAGKRAALSVYSSKLQLRCSNSITGPQESSSRSELFAKWATKNVIAFCWADRNLSSKSLARYIPRRKRKSKVLRWS